MKILLVKISSMGDIAHTTPVIADILQVYPHAQIDWLVEENFIDMIKHVRGIHTTLPVAIRRWRQHLLQAKTWKEIRLFIKTLRQTHYDWVIDAQGLIKSALLASLAHGRVCGLANRTEGASYEWPARFFYNKRVYIAPHTHVVTRSRLLAANCLDYSLPTQLNFGFIAHGTTDFNALAGRPYIIFAHATSRADKTWPLASWVALGKHLITSGYHIVLPWGNSNEKKISEEIASFLGDASWIPPHLTLSQITELLATASAIVGVDTGLSHIAAALAQPTIQLYRFDTAWRTGGLGSEKLINLGGKHHLPTPTEVTDALKQVGVL